MSIYPVKTVYMNPSAERHRQNLGITKTIMVHQAVDTISSVA